MLPALSRSQARVSRRVSALTLTLPLLLALKKSSWKSFVNLYYFPFVSFLVTRSKPVSPGFVCVVLVWVNWVCLCLHFFNLLMLIDVHAMQSQWGQWLFSETEEDTSPCPNVRAYSICYHNIVQCTLETVPLTFTFMPITSSFRPQLSICACNVSHVLEIWFAHILSSGGFAGQRGCHSHRAHGWGRCPAGVQGTEQEVCLVLALAYQQNITIIIIIIITTIFQFPVISAVANWCFPCHHYGFVGFSCSCARTNACRSWSVWSLQSPLLV